MDLNKLSDNPYFRSSSLFNLLIDSPLSFCDVGARGGVHDYIFPIARHTDVLAFEPSSQECKNLEHKHNSNRIFKSLTMIDRGLYSIEKEIELCHASVATNTSLLQVNPHFYNRYNLRKWETTHKETINVTTIDNLSTGEFKALKDIDFIKVDTQGTEFEILQGSEKVLQQSALCVVAEVSFFEIYKGQKTFDQVVRLLADYGFSFYGFTALHTRSQKRLDKRNKLTRERYMQADAVFFKDPLDPVPSKCSHESIGRLIVIAILLEYYDYALELAASYCLQTSSSDFELISLLILGQSEHNPNNTIAEISSLQDKFLKCPELANLELGAMLDKYRLYNDYKDVNHVSSLPDSYGQ